MRDENGRIMVRNFIKVPHGCSPILDICKGWKNVSAGNWPWALDKSSAFMIILYRELMSFKQWQSQCLSLITSLSLITYSQNIYLFTILYNERNLTNANKFGELFCQNVGQMNRVSSKLPTRLRRIVVKGTSNRIGLQRKQHRWRSRSVRFWIKWDKM